MKKKYLIMIVTLVFSITVFLVVLGIFFNKSTFEKQQGMTDVYDVSSNGIIAYVAYEKGNPGIYLKHGTEEFKNPVLQLSNDKEILDVDFEPDGTSLAYIESNKNAESNLRSSVHLLDTQTLEQTDLFATKTLITEIAFDPKEKDLLLYLKAGAFENYSPIASAHPHEFDLYSYQIAGDAHRQHTKLNQYAMASLQVSASENSAFVQMFDDAHVETADDVFAEYQKVFQIPLDDPGEMSVVSKKDRDTDIYDFTVIPNTDEIIFQTVSGEGNDGIFEYELYHYNWDTKEERQLTHLKEHAGKPVVDADNNNIFFVVDKQFAGKRADYRLYQMDVDGKNIEEISLDVEEK